MEEGPEHRALKSCYDKLVSGMVPQDVLPKFIARDFVTEFERQAISAAAVSMDANEKLLSAILRQGGQVVVFLCRVLFEVKLKELGWRLYHALKTEEVDVSEIRHLSRIGHFSHPLKVIVLPQLQVRLASLLARVQGQCEKVHFTSLRRFTITILCHYQLIQNPQEMEKIQTLDALFDILSISLKWHWYDPLNQIVGFVNSPELKAALETFSSEVKEYAEKKLNECSSVVESLTRLPPHGELLETVLDVDPEAAEVQDILRNQAFLKMLGVEAALFLGEKNSRTTLFWWIPRALVSSLMASAIDAIGDMKLHGVAELRVSGFFKIVSSTGTCTYYESATAFDVDDTTFFHSILEDREKELRIAQQAVADSTAREMALKMKTKGQHSKDELQTYSKFAESMRQKFNESEKQRKIAEEEKRKLKQENDELKGTIEELTERCSKGKMISGAQLQDEGVPPHQPSTSEDHGTTTND